ncbi:LIC_13215 family putative lipoprotein [Leptospira licerasiae]|uniref:Lipoprotein n=1 Tax=Leptospira licerasiae str. MMD4847 TaxID=1049971 RepID=A0ABN0HCR7_9LEPT|nr:hypothetical protein [Leptospira licerasiae]EIE03255.1 hypothetical protein LEP1GSC185_1032 [Leptospira licerasiae serovar Varillal str. VAR 010]EJZ43307.1 hypothetical protein LEP1GSC178_3512 [Leptospira licerasiae str. MMD4847]
MILLERYSLGLLLPGIILCFACIEKVPEIKKTIEIPELGLILNYEGWIYEEYDPNRDSSDPNRSKSKREFQNDKQVKVMFYLFEPEQNKSSEIRTNINFISEPIPAKYSKATLEDYVASIGGLYSNIYKEYEILSVPQKCSFGKEKCIFLESKFALPNTAEKKQIRTLQWIFFKEGYVYVFTGTIPESEYSEKNKKVLNTIQTLTEKKEN